MNGANEGNHDRKQYVNIHMILGTNIWYYVYIYIYIVCILYVCNYLDGKEQTPWFFTNFLPTCLEIYIGRPSMLPMVHSHSRSMVHILHSGKLLHNYGKSPFIVDLPMKNGGSFHKCLHNCGKSPCFWWVNQLFRLGHGFKFANCKRLPEINH